MTSERQFAKLKRVSGVGMTWPTAKQVRESVQLAVKESRVLAKPKLVEPLDYENVIVQKKTLMHSDLQRDMLFFPHDDVAVVKVPRQLRTVRSTVPANADQEATNLFVKECIKSYNSDWYVVKKKYDAYSGHYMQLPNVEKIDSLPEQVYEIDQSDDKAEEEDTLLSPRGGIEKKGVLFKAPFGSKSKIPMMESFKKRFFHLRQLPDKSYVLEYLKEDKSKERMTTKGTLFLDSLVEVVKNQKSRKYGFELRMQDKSLYQLASDSENDLEDWINAFNKIIQQGNEDKQSISSTDELEQDDDPLLSPSKPETLRESLEQSKHPELMKYAKETERLNAIRRKDGRQKLFGIYPTLQTVGRMLAEEKLPTVTPFKEHFGTRVMVVCEELKFRLSAVINEHGEIVDSQEENTVNLEPFYISFALFDAKESKKISEDFRVDLNNPYARNLLTKSESKDIPNGGGISQSENQEKVIGYGKPDLGKVDESWLKYPKQGLFSVTAPHSEIYLVARIEKVLQGNITTCVEPYMKSGDILKLSQKLLKQAKIFCHRMGDYRMPFAWAARPLFQDKQVDPHADFTPFYKQESARLSDDDLLKHLKDIKASPDKLGKLQVVPGSLKISVNPVKALPPNCLTPSLVPLDPYPIPPITDVLLEIEEFIPEEGRFSYPHTNYVNHLYVYPRSLKYDGQKAFNKARNIAVVVEFRDSDEEGAQPLQCIRGRPGSPVFVTHSSAAVLHHFTTPEFYEETKIVLPTQLHDKHHLLFSFYHISCEQSKGTVKRKDTVETLVGYAWIQVLSNSSYDRTRPSRINVDDIIVPVAGVTHLPSGYLSCKILGLGKTSGPEVKWIEGGKPLFSVHNKIVSTIYTKDPHIHNFFIHCHVYDNCSTYNVELCKLLKALHAVDTFTIIQFLPVILNQLFRILADFATEDIQLNTVRLLIHIVACIHEVGREDALHSYVKHVFVTEKPNTQKKTVHEELVKNMAFSLRPSTDPQVSKNLMRYLWFFFEILIKSMAQYLVNNNLMALSRNRRFPANYVYSIQNLLQTIMSRILLKYKENREDSKLSNFYLATFIKDCFTYMDRGVIFKLINIYADYFNPGDHKILLEMKFEFYKVVCNHEHFIALNLPLQHKGKIQQFKDEDESLYQDEEFIFTYSGRWRNYDLQHDYCLTDEFCRNHFLVGLLLREISCGLHETKESRKCAISVLRNLLVKHSFDDRYKSKAMQARIASLYLPFISVILENAPRLNLRDQTPSSKQSTPQSNGDTPTMTPDGSFPSHVMPSRSSMSLDSGQLDNTSYSTMPSITKTTSARDSSVLDLIAGNKGIVPLLSGSTPGICSGDNMSNSNNQGIRRSSFSIDSGRGSGKMPSLSGSMPAISKPTPLNDNIIPSHISSAYSSSQGSGTPSISTPRLMDNRSSKSGSSVSLISGNSTVERSSSEKVAPNGHSRTPSTSGNIFFSYDKLEESEVKDLLVCLLYILKNLNEEIILGWWNQSTEKEQIEFFQILEICLYQFRYQGKKLIAAIRPIKFSLAEGDKSKTLPPRIVRPHTYAGRSLSMATDIAAQLVSSSDADSVYRSLLEANMATEVGITVLDIICLYCLQFKHQLEEDDGDNILMRKVFDIFLSYLQMSQSEVLLKHVFAGLRTFISKFPTALFKGHAHLCGDLCYEILRCCNSKLSSTRNEACALLYLLMRNNFEYTGRREFVRVHIQVIISVSRLISDIVVLNSARFQESLATINNYANSDKAMQHTHFPTQVKDLTKKIRTVLMATAQMKEHENDPEMLVDLQYSLAKSYASTPELRKTWLESMARIHEKNRDFSEAAYCYIHVAALVAEYLKRKDIFKRGCTAFRLISPNVESEEQGIKDDKGMHDVQYTEDHLIALLEQCAEYLEKSERYEIMGELYRLIIPFYEKERDFQRLAEAYSTLHRVHDKVVEVMQSGRRLLGSYFRIAFFGQQYFEEEDGKEYIYKEPKVTSLAEISTRLQKMYGEKFGPENVKLMKSSDVVDPKDLDSKYAYIQVTYVTVYFDEKELRDRQTDFEKNNNVRRFMFETPFTRGGKSHGSIEEQFKRRTILTASHAFPYVKKRILVVYQIHQELTPIEVAIDEMRKKVCEMNEILSLDAPDMKRLQLKLQGSVSTQVNAGPLAYASAFLEGNISQYDSMKVRELKEIFRQFVKACGELLEINAKLIKSDQLHYHDDMKQKYKQMVLKLSEILSEELVPGLETEKSRPTSLVNRSSMNLFTAISGQSNA